LGVNIHLISYLPGERFRIIHKQTSECLDTTTICIRRRWPKYIKAFGLLPIFLFGLRYIKKSAIVLAHSPGVVSGLPALILAKLFRKLLLIDHMDIKDPDTPWFIYNKVLRNADTVMAISQYLKEEAREKGCKNVVYLPIFIDTDFFQKDTLARARIRKELGIEDRGILIGYTGSFWRGEGLALILQAFRNLSLRHRHIRLALIGTGNVADSDDIAGLVSRLQLEDVVTLVSPQPHELMPKYLSAFDIACSPKIDCEENRAANPVKIYEYMSMGLPTVASAVGEISNVIQDGIDGFLIRPGDQSDLKATLDHAIQNHELAKKVGERAREKMISSYSQETGLRKIEAIFRTLRAYKSEEG